MPKKEFAGFNDLDSYRVCSWEDIKADLKANHPEYADTIKAQIEAKTSFLKIKRDYYDKYYPKAMPKKKPGKMSLD